MKKLTNKQRCGKCIHKKVCEYQSYFINTEGIDRCNNYSPKANKCYRKQSEGEWVDEPHFAQRGLKGKYYVCSKCNVCVPTIEELPLFLWHYCPHCGAKMKGGAE